MTMIDRRECQSIHTADNFATQELRKTSLAQHCQHMLKKIQNTDHVISLIPFYYIRIILFAYAYILYIHVFLCSLFIFYLLSLVLIMSLEQWSRFTACYTCRSVCLIKDCSNLLRCLKFLSAYELSY